MRAERDALVGPRCVAGYAHRGSLASRYTRYDEAMERERRGTRIASVRLVATSLISRHIQALPARRGALDQEGVRVVGAVAALLAAALVVAGGLLWRENGCRMSGGKSQARATLDICLLPSLSANDPET